MPSRDSEAAFPTQQPPGPPQAKPHGTQGPAQGPSSPSQPHTPGTPSPRALVAPPGRGLAHMRPFPCAPVCEGGRTHIPHRPEHGRSCPALRARLLSACCHLAEQGQVLRRGRSGPGSAGRAPRQTDSSERTALRAEKARAAWRLSSNSLPGDSASREMSLRPCSPIFGASGMTTQGGYDNRGYSRPVTEEGRGSDPQPPPVTSAQLVSNGHSPTHRAHRQQRSQGDSPRGSAPAWLPVCPLWAGWTGQLETQRVSSR